MKQQNTNQEVAPEIDDSPANKLEYEQPILICYGDVRDITLGPTFGTSESGCEFARRAGSPLECP